MKNTSLLLIQILTLTAAAPAAFAAGTSSNSNATPSGTPANSVSSGDASSSSDGSAESPSVERVNVESIKQKYWARGDAAELGVVQNRTYSKDHKFEIGVFGGFVTTDPFINVKNTGFQFGYHWSEYISTHFVYWHDYVSPSSALETFQDTIGATTNYNPPRNYYGGEVEGSILYGKLSLMGKKIIYYDLHLIGGVGLMNTDNGTYFTPDIGIGQQVYLTKSIALRLDYRLMTYHEAIKEEVIISRLGQIDGYRQNWTNAITIGFDFLFGGGSSQDSSRDAAKGGYR